MSIDLTTRFHESSFKRHFIMIRFALALLGMLDTQLASVPKTKSARNLPTFTPFLGGGVVTSGKSWTRCAEACQARGRATFSHHDERVSRSVFSRPVIHDRCQTTGVGVTLCAEIRHFLVFAWSFSKRMRQRQCCSPQVGQANRNASEMWVRSMCSDNDTLI